jgi:hypothetical protein
MTVSAAASRLHESGGHRHTVQEDCPREAGQTLQVLLELRVQVAHGNVTDAVWVSAAWFAVLVERGVLCSLIDTDGAVCLFVKRTGTIVSDAVALKQSFGMLAIV